MSITPAVVETSTSTSTLLVRLQQLQIYASTACLLVALWQVICNCTLACLASLGAAKSSVKENAHSSLLLLKQASCSTSVHVGAWLKTPLAAYHNRHSTVVTFQQHRQLPAAVQVSNYQCKSSVSLSSSYSSSSTAASLYRLPPQLPQHSGQLCVCLDLDETLLCTYRLQQGPDSLQLVPSNWTASTSSSTRRRRSFTSALLDTSGAAGISLYQRRLSTGGTSSCGGCYGYAVSTSGPCEGELGLLGREVGASCWVHYTPLQQGSSAGFGNSISNSSWNSGSTTTLAVFERPGVRQFLQELAQFAEVVLFTAASAAYAEPLVDLLDPQRSIFRARLYSDACVTACGREGVKDLQDMGRSLGRTVLVDNSPYSFLVQPANGLPCLPYHGEQEDKQLLGVILPLLRSLSQLDDIRPLLASKFRIQEWLVSKGLDVPPVQYTAA